MATYATAAELRDQPEVPDDLPDAEADRLIETAEDLIDSQLSQPRDVNGDPLAIDVVTGRRVTKAGVEGWRWAKLSRATLLVAAVLYMNPELARGRLWQSERGPDYSLSGPLGDELGRQVVALLAATGWYRGRSGSARVGSVADDLPFRRDLSLPTH